MDDVISLVRFDEIRLDDPFFDSLKEDYKNFDIWFTKKCKSGQKAYINKDEKGIHAFLYCKDETGDIDPMVVPPMNSCRRMKVGTFKVEGHNTKLGDRLLKKVFDLAVVGNFDEVYLTVFPKHTSLISRIQCYGFELTGKKGDELVYTKNMKVLTDDIIKNYPLLSTVGRKKYLLAIYPKYHTRLFPDSILRNEEGSKYNLIQDIAATNSIHKTYICFMDDAKVLKRGDLVVIYRTNDGLGPARYRSVVSSVCQVVETKTRDDFSSIDEYVEYSSTSSIFSEDELRLWYNKRNLLVIKMTYNIALTKRVTRGILIDEIGIPENIYWGFFELKDDQFDSIIMKGEINENTIID